MGQAAVGNTFNQNLRCRDFAFVKTKMHFLSI